MLAGVVEALLASVALAALLTGVGVALRVLLSGRLTLPDSAAVSAGLGAAVLSVVVALSFRLVGTSVRLLALVLATCVVLLVAGAVRGLRAAADRPGLLRAWVGHVANPADALSAVLAVVLMSRLLPLGLTFWTSGPGDWHRYVASVQVWLSGEVGEPAFEGVHSGDFLDTQLDRALSEKPLVTALLLASTRTLGVADFQLLTPITLVLLWIAFAAAGHVVARRVGVGRATAMLAVAATTASLLPMWPAYAAQVGHLAVVAGAFTWLVVLAAPRRGRLAGALVGGVALAFTAGANISVVGGVTLVLAALGVWVQLRDRSSRSAAAAVVGTGLVAGVLLLPYLPWFVRAISVQAAGTEGSAIPLASPLGFVGLQVSLLASAPLAQAVVSWGALGAVALLLARPARAWTESGRWAALVAGAAGATVIGLSLAFGPSNYAVAKTVMVIVAVVMPFALAAAVARLLGLLPRHRPAVLSAAAALAVAAVVLAWQDGSPALAGARPELGALADDARLRDLERVTIDIDDYAANAMASVIVPTRRIVMARATYANADPPVGDVFLTTDRQASAEGSEVLADLGGDYVLVRRDLTLGTGVLEVGTDPSAAAHLYGYWQDPPGARIWTTATVNWFVGDLEPALVGRDLVLTFTGVGIEDGRPDRVVEAFVGDQAVGSTRVRAGTDSELVVPVPAESVPDDGRLAVRLVSAGPLHPWEVATPEYSLETVVVEVAGP